MPVNFFECTHPGCNCRVYIGSGGMCHCGHCRDSHVPRRGNAAAALYAALVAGTIGFNIWKFFH